MHRLKNRLNKSVMMIESKGAIVTDNRPSRSRPRNLTIIGIAGLAGLVTVIIVIAALVLGLWIDSQLGMKGPFTIVLVVLSVPVSLVLMMRIVLTAANAVLPPASTDESSTITKED